MTTQEYKSLSLEERRVFFIAALVPVNIRTENGTDGKPRYTGFADLLGAESHAERADVLAAVDALAEKGVIKDGRPGGRTARETLAAIAEEADRRGWWPPCEVFAKAYEPIMMANMSDYQRKGKTPEQLCEMARAASKSEADFSELMMASWLSLATGDGRAYAERIRERDPENAGRFACEAVLAASQAFVELVDDDPDFDAMPQSFCGMNRAEQVCIWLECAFWHGRDVRKTLKALGERPMLSAALMQVYAALCVWTGWREGLTRPFAFSDAFCKGCRVILDGDFNLAYKLMDPLRKKKLLRGSVPCFLVYLVFRAVSPEKSQVLQGILGWDCLWPDFVNRYSRAACAASTLLRGGWSDTGNVLKHFADNLASSLNAAFASRRLDNGDRIVFCRSHGGRWADKIREIVECGYVNVGGVILSLVPLLGAEENAKPVLRAMEQRGTWILPYRAVKPLWELFTANLARETTNLRMLEERENAREEQGNAREGEGVSRKITWLVTCREPGRDGLLSVRRVGALCREKRSGGEVTCSRVEPEALLLEEYAGCMNESDRRLVNMVLARKLDDYWHGDPRRQAEVISLLCGMDNLELEIESNDGETRESRPVRIEERDCARMRIVAADDGSVTIQLQDCRTIGNGFKLCGYVLRETERADLLVFMRVEPVVGRVARLLDLYGTDGVMRIPREGVEKEMSAFEWLSKAVPQEEAFAADDGEIPEVKADTTCFARLEFRDGALTVHVCTRPVAQNVQLAFEPGYGQKSCVISGEGGAYRIVRDFEGENAAFRPVKETMTECDAWFDGRCSWQVRNLSEAVSVVNKLKGMTPAIDIEWRKGRSLKVSRPKFKLKSGEGGNGWFEVRGEFALDDGRVMDVMKLLSAMREAGVESGYVRLADGDYVALTKEMQRQLGALAVAGREEDGKLEIPRGAIPILQAVFGGEGVALPDAMALAAEKVRDALASEPEPPRTLQAQLRPYQLEGYRWMSRLASCGFGACLADDMGLGKTLQIITLLLERAKDGPSLVVAPASVCENWRNEIQRFAPTLKPVMAIEDGQGVAKAGPRAVVLASYGYLLFHEKEFATKQWNGLVLDEAQAIKNESARRTRAVKGFQAKFRVAATGTPVENRLLELWSIFDFLNAGLLGTADGFEERNRGEIKRLVKPLILRRLKGEVLDDLPPKTEVTRFVELGTKERSEYEACRLKVLDDVSQADRKQRLAQLLAGLTRLRRFCCNPSLVLGGDDLASAKLDALAELMAELHDGGHRALVFSQFTDYLAIVRKMVEEKGWSIQYLDGSTPLKERARRVDAFQNGEGDFFLISLKAGGAGLNLTAADYVIILDPWWNPAVENQAADRAHRIGQNRPVTIYRLIARDTVEERVLAPHKEKRDLAADMLDGTGSSRLNSEILMGLLQGPEEGNSTVEQTINRH